MIWNSARLIKNTNTRYSSTSTIILKHTQEIKLPFELSWISSKIFSSSERSFWNCGILSSSFGIKLVDSSHSFFKSSIFVESCNKRQDKIYACARYELDISPHLFKLIIKFLNLLLYVLQILTIFNILTFKVLKFFLGSSQVIIKFLNTQVQNTYVN